MFRRECKGVLPWPELLCANSTRKPKQYKKTTRTRRIITIAVAAVLLLAILAGVLVSVRNNRREARQAAAEKALQERIVKVTFPEGSTVLDIAQKLEENNVCTADEFEAVCTKVPEGRPRRLPVPEHL